jgi:hypothetical protein
MLNKGHLWSHLDAAPGIERERSGGFPIRRSDPKPDSVSEVKTGGGGTLR